jgi:hypothetical protein
VLLDVAAHPDTATSEVVKRLQLPRKTVDRVLQELHLLGLLVVDEIAYGDKVRWIYSLAGDVSTGTVAKLARNVSTPERRDCQAVADKPPDGNRSDAWDDPQDDDECGATL